MPQSRICKKCKMNKEFKEFNNGRQGYCKECENQKRETNTKITPWFQPYLDHLDQQYVLSTDEFEKMIIKQQRANWLYCVDQYIRYGRTDF